MIIVDASVVYKWIIDENDEATVAARRVRNQFLAGNIDILAPELLLYEIANVLSYKSHLSEPDVKQAWKSFLLFNIPTVAVTKMVAGQCLALSQKYHISVYDAAYVVLAQKKKCRFITADIKLVERVNLPRVRSV